MEYWSNGLLELLCRGCGMCRECGMVGWLEEWIVGWLENEDLG